MKTHKLKVTLNEVKRMQELAGIQNINELRYDDLSDDEKSDYSKRNIDIIKSKVKSLKLITDKSYLDSITVTPVVNIDIARNPGNETLRISYVIPSKRSVKGSEDSNAYFYVNIDFNTKSKDIYAAGMARGVNYDLAKSGVPQNLEKFLKDSIDYFQNLGNSDIQKIMSEVDKILKNRQRYATFSTKL